MIEVFKFFHTLDISPQSKAKYVLDITNKEKVSHLFNLYDLVLCTNTLEHVKSVEKAVNNLTKLVRKGGYIIITWPVNLPKHRGYSNGFRPTKKQIEKMFARFELVVFNTWVDKHYRKPFSSSNCPLPVVSGAMLRKM